MHKVDELDKGHIYTLWQEKRQMMKTTFGGIRPLVEYYLQRKTTIGEEDLSEKTTFGEI